MKLRNLIIILTVLVFAACAAGCADGGTPPDSPPETTPEATPGATATPDAVPTAAPGIINAPLPEHTAVSRTYYEIFVGSFYDSDGDGMGDLRGVVEKLDYLNSPDGADSLGVQGIWLMPIHPSPTYHKYDVLDYYAIDPEYGTMEDFELLISEAGARGINIIIDLVINHTSSRHPWFLAALDEIENGAEPYYQNFYNFSDERLGSAYYPTVGGMFYEAHFWDQMPDLNMDSPELREEIADIARFWLEKGVAGFRLDAVMHVYTNQEKNIEFWTWFAEMCRDVREDVFLVGEVWSNERTIMPYFETGLALFNFPFHGHDGTINTSIRNASGNRLASELARYDSEIRMRNPEGVNCLFLSNHDTGRSAGFLMEIERQKLAAAIYLLAPGSPFIYYGEEIGMRGSGIDENKRTAMHWSSNDSTGITRNPAAATNDFVPEFGVAEQLADANSLLNYYRAVLRVKAHHQDIYDNAVEMVTVDNDGICAIRMGGVIVMHNLTDEAVSIQNPAPGAELADYLSPLGERAVQAGETLTIPAFSTVILKG